MLICEYNVNKVLKSNIISGQRIIKASHPMGAIVSNTPDERSIINALRAADYLHQEAVTLDLSGAYPLVVSQVDGEVILELIPLD